MNLVNQFKAFFKNAGEIKTPTNRKDFWLQFIIFFVTASILTTLSPFIQLIPYLGIFTYITLLIYIQFAFISLSIRRLHDANYSGWWTLLWLFGMLSFKTLVKTHLNYDYGQMMVGNFFIFFSLIPIVILWCQKTKSRNNKYLVSNK
jgi:uncharacterized membrane protein YhaH (DUF805 family)